MRFAPIALLLLTSIAGDLGAQQAAQREGASARPERAAAARNQTPRRADWWNDEAVAGTLKLTAEQRKKADEALAAQRAPAAASDLEAARTRLTTALVANDKAGAKAAAAEIGRLRNRPFEQQVDLTLAVMALLEPGQRQLLGSKYPQLLTRGGGMQRPAGPRARSAAR